MNTLTAILTTIVLATAISYNTASTRSVQPDPIGPAVTGTIESQNDEVQPIGPPPTYDGGDTPVCLSCD
jgi:hypothetical protein